MKLKKTNIFEHTSYVDFLKEVYAFNVERGKINYDMLGKQLAMSKMKAYYLFNGGAITEEDILKIKYLLNLNKNEFMYFKILVALNNENFPDYAKKQTLDFLKTKYLKLEKEKRS